MNDTDSNNTNQKENKESLLIPKLNMENKNVEKTKDSAEKVTSINTSKNNKEPKKVKKKKRMSKKLKIVLLTFFLVFVLVVSFGVYVGYLGYNTYQKALVVRADAMRLVDAGKAQNLPLVKEEMVKTRSSFDSFADAYSKLTWLSRMPYLGEYVKDGSHGIAAAYHGFDSMDIMIEAVEPYADILGLNGVDDGTQTAQERLDFVVSTLPALIPQADLLSEKVTLLRDEVDMIDPERYPEEFQGIAVRSQLTQAIELIDQGEILLSQGKPLLKVAPDLLGTEESRTYLVLFQNDKELRATGGFITAYSIARVERGKFEPVASNDIYNLDNLYRPTIPAPEPIITMLKGPYLISPNLRLRDMNWSPDFKESMDLFLKEAEKVGVEDIDGIVAVDTQAVVNILDVIGPIDVPGYGEFSTNTDDRCNCPQIVYELESFADVEGAVVWDQNDPTKIIFAPDNYENRKVIIGPLMNSILSNALGQSKEKIPALFEAGMNSVLEKNVLLYMVDEEEQRAVEEFGIGGTIKPFEGDYLHINDSNLGGRKSNLYVEQEVEHEIEIENDGTVTKTVLITYTNTEEHDGWLNSVLPSWVRIYVPEGSELIDVSGLSDIEETYVELGKTVFAGSYELRPKGVAQIELTYTLPFKVQDTYNLFIQKQPGTDMPVHTIILDNYEESITLDIDKKLEIEL